MQSPMIQIRSIKFIVFTFLFISVFFYSRILTAQEADTTVQSDYDGILYIPAQWNKVLPSSIQSRVADVFNDTAHEIDNLYVADWWWVDDIIYEEGYAVDQSIDPSLALAFGEECEVGDVFLFDVTKFTQVGSAETPEDASSNILVRAFVGILKALFEDKPENKSEPHYDNIRTEIEVRLRLIDVNEAVLTETFTMGVSYVGGIKSESLNHALEKLGDNIRAELRRRYTPIATITGFDHTKLLLDEGRDSGMLKGKSYEIFSPDYMDQTDSENRVIYGTSAGYAKITFADSNRSRAAVMRQWAPVDTGFVLLALERMIQGAVINASIPVGQNYAGIGLGFNYQPIKEFDGGAEIRVITAQDNFNKDNWGVGFGVYGSWRFLNMPQFAMKARLDGDFDIFFRTDAEEDLANLPLFSLSPGIVAEFLISPESDLVVHAGYRIWGKSSGWEKSGDEDETIDAVWKSDPPKVNLSGLFLKIGYRFYFGS